MWDLKSSSNSVIANLKRICSEKNAENVFGIKVRETVHTCSYVSHPRKIHTSRHPKVWVAGELDGMWVWWSPSDEYRQTLTKVLSETQNELDI